MESPVASNILEKISEATQSAQGKSNKQQVSVEKLVGGAGGWRGQMKETVI